MNLERISLFILSLTFCFLSCGKDDGGDDEVEIVFRDRTEQQVIDNDSIVGYLETHYYNSDDFIGNPDPSIADLAITPLVEGESVPTGHTLLKEAVGVSKKVVYLDVDYEYYVLNINQGGGADSPTFADNILVSYEGFTLDNEVFDSAINPVEFDLTTLIPGWRKVFPQFNTAESFVENIDGTVNFVNPGVGVMFLPSGLAYFSSSQSGIPSYSPLIFKFELVHTTENDHDNDGILSYLEDLNGDGEFSLNTEAGLQDGDDTDEDGVPNYFDPDDDGDGVPTINEDLNDDGDPTNDIGKNGIPNYLDPEETDSK
ncbi:peptidylprolyl isomerase [Seonamhaeicola maritimus]|uniref:Peptidyl-prolyl cis-trans isomerase n=2 Tax=Seonamhaeicola maritimus TaxID=2591822 RepID=A0A5C7GLR2_9FLAO|nr:peptidylprolyl isomerase [Seonamhaeicola maritimus]